MVALLAGSAAAAFSVPSVVFDGGEAPSEGGGLPDAMPGLDATLDDVVDAGGDDAPDAADGAIDAPGDAEGGPTCALPQDDASVCCGAVVCQGDCNIGNCSTCETKCTDAQVCCVKATSITCHNAGTSCP